MLMGNGVGVCVGSGVVITAGVRTSTAAMVGTDVKLAGVATGAHAMTSSIKPLNAPVRAANLLTCLTTETVLRFMSGGYCMPIARLPQSRLAYERAPEWSRRNRLSLLVEHKSMRQASSRAGRTVLSGGVLCRSRTAPRRRGRRMRIQSGAPSFPHVSSGNPCAVAGEPICGQIAVTHHAARADGAGARQDPPPRSSHHRTALLASGNDERGTAK